jgi:hypothetical protein
LLKQNAEQSGGNLALSSEPGKGTTVTARFGLRHIDRPAMGDIAGVFLLSAIGHPGIRLLYSHITPEGSFSVSSEELRETLGDVPMHNAEMMEAIRDLIRNNLEMIKASK